MTKEGLKSWRNGLKKTQTEMAFVLGVSYPTYLQWESGKKMNAAAKTMLYAMKFIIQKGLYDKYKELREIENMVPDENGLYPGEKIEVEE